jgi:hypothetical protein
MKSISFCSAAPFLIIAAMTSAAAAPLASFNTPRDVIVALYRLPGIPITPEDKHRFFGNDLAAALIADSARDDEVGVANDGDYRFDAQDMRISDLRIASPVTEAGGASIRVTFRNFGKASTVLYSICARGLNDWRIKDITTPSGGSLRRLLSLPAAPQTKDC